MDNLLESYEALHDPDGRQLLEDLLGNEEILLFFNQDEDPAVFSFPAGYRLQEVIGECVGFVFYVTNRETTFLVSFIDHDMLLVNGTVADHLRRITGDRS